MAKAFRHRIEWDPIKVRRNVRKHGIAFERAATVFRDPAALSQFDEERRGRTLPMLELVTERETAGTDATVRGTLDELAREGARRMIEVALRVEVEEGITRHREERDALGMPWWCATAPPGRAR